MACVCIRYNARSDWIILERYSLSRNAHGPIMGLQKTKQNIAVQKFFSAIAVLINKAVFL